MTMIMILIVITYIALKPTLVNASKIKDHILMNQHTGILDDFTKLVKGGDNKLTETKESIFIKILKPTLNYNTKSKKLFLFNLFIIVQLYSNDENIFNKNHLRNLLCELKMYIVIYKNLSF